MNMLLTVIEGCGIAVASFILAVLLCCASWNLFKLVRHPELGMPLVLMFVAFACETFLRSNQILSMAMLFSIPGAVVSWFAGLEWRHDHPWPSATSGRNREGAKL